MHDAIRRRRAELSRQIEVLDRVTAFTVTDYRAPDGMRISLPAMPGEGRPLRQERAPEPPAPPQRQVRKPVLAELARRNSPASVREIAGALGETDAVVRWALHKLHAAGQVRRTVEGRAAYWSLP